MDTSIGKTMASVDDIEVEEFIKCGICFQIFNSPRYLPCLHTFCESCLSEHIKSSATTENCTKTPSKIFPCPLCKTDVLAPNPAIYPEEWVGTFPFNHLMVTIMDKQKLKNNAKSCDPCFARKLGKTAIAWCCACGEALCENCEEFHRSMKISRDHKIFKIEEIASEQPFITTQEYCEEHRDKKIETFCFDHNKPCCYACMTLYHRKCDRVTTLDEAATDVRKKTELADCKEQMKSIETKLDELYLATESNIKDLNNQKEGIEKELKALRVEINRHLDDLESLLQEEYTNSHNEQTDQLKQKATEFDNKRKMVENSQKMLDMCTKHATDQQLFLEMKKQQRRQNELKDFLLSRIPEVKRIDFELNVEEDLLWITSSLQSIGNVTIKTSNFSEDTGTFLKSPAPKAAMPAFLRSYKVEEITSFTVKNPEQFSHWHGIVVLKDGRLLLSDWTSKTLVLYSEDGELHGEILLSGQPYDVTVITDNELAVSRRSERTIDIVDIERKVVTRQIRLQHMCFGITILDSKLVVACDTNIVILTLEGKTVREIPVNSGVYCVTSSGNDGSICYTNFARGTVNGMSIDGVSIFSYSDDDLKGTLGVTTDNDGNVYVAGRERSCVYQLSPDGVMMKTILSKETGIENPWAVQIAKESNKLLVTHSGSKVTIYKLMAMYDYY